MANCIIKIQGADIAIDEIGFEKFTRERDDRGRPSGPVKPALIQVKRNPLFSSKAVVDWYSKRSAESITIEIKEEIDGQMTSITIELTDAYVVEYSIEYSESGTRQITEVFKMTAKEIKIEGVEFKWDWPQV
ncbi:type VI secretion system tube protein TssD [Flavilitoribacter nigricans]|uniref:Phage tail protein n=1 Tax=Flavilitoribacter nigricans (strain ATCC 23147 / DSM 23189 / NBRC 102662 / NCIMB 1420 / SS-2) TaxID=1122177 RepID=A0A2D0N9P5_FLAN2|nr:type VI secretion system tube protein TssD [Flavilitoribacter nigricans]PHN05108.1 hypothetical protein CRP01_18985 [Flavilitoribacter nigricans DSM 23189 = NBRC 102662]